MLTEFALMPSIFEEDAHADKEAWRAQLRELIAAMFPRTSAWPILISDLCEGSWSSTIMPHVQGIQDHRAKKYCQDLLTNMQQMLVKRPMCRDWPHDDDVAWCREAVATNAVEPIERIVSIRSTREAMVDEYAFVRSIDEVEDAAFWQGIGEDASPKMIIDEQVSLLRKLCLHSQWVALINPYGLLNEQEFSLRLLDIALSRHSSFGHVTLELHAEAPDVVDSVERQKRQERVILNMSRKIQQKLESEGIVDLYFWPKLRERILVAGNFVNDSVGRRKSPRWGVSMSHVALGAEQDAPRAEWKLLSSDSLDRWFREYVAEDAAGKPTQTTIRSEHSKQERGATNEHV